MQVTLTVTCDVKPSQRKITLPRHVGLCGVFSTRGDNYILARGVFVAAF